MSESANILYAEAASDPNGWKAKLNTYNKMKREGETLEDTMKRVSSAYKKQSKQYKKSKDNDLNEYEKKVKEQIEKEIKDFVPDDKWEFEHHESPSFYKDEAEMIKKLKKAWGEDVDFENRVKIGKEYYFKKINKQKKLEDEMIRQDE